MGIVATDDAELKAIEPLAINLLRRDADRRVHELSSRVLVLEVQARASNDRLNSIESELRGVKDAVNGLAFAMQAHMQAEEKQKTQILTWVVATLLSVIGCGVLIIYELLKSAH